MLQIIRFIIGILGLGVIILIHELGHLIAARLTGIRVKVFSIGFGPKLISWKPKETEYCLSLIPLGGYCRMEHELAQEDSATPDPHSFAHARPLQKIFILSAGPLANILMAFVSLFFIGLIGIPVETYGNKIVVASDLQTSDTPLPADQAGLTTGDSILHVDERPVQSFFDIQNIVSDSAHTPLTMLIMNENGSQRSVTITPTEEPFLGEGRIGVYPWVDPLVASVKEGTPAAAAGLLPGDRILQARDVPLRHALELESLVQDRSTAASMEVLRDSQRVQLTMVPPQGEDSSLGIQFPTRTIIHKEPAPLISSIRQITDIVTSTLRGIRYVISQGRFTEAVAGPIQITFFTGEAATGSGGFNLLYFINFLAILSVAVAFMNLLPIPVTDGGQIILALIELFRKKPISRQVQHWYQLAGIGIIGVIFFFAILGDINFLRELV